MFPPPNPPSTLKVYLMRFRAIRLSVHACCAIESYGKSQSKLKGDCTGRCADCLIPCAASGTTAPAQPTSEELFPNLGRQVAASQLPCMAGQPGSSRWLSSTRAVSSRRPIGPRSLRGPEEICGQSPSSSNRGRTNTPVVAAFYFTASAQSKGGGDETKGIYL